MKNQKNAKKILTLILCTPFFSFGADPKASPSSTTTTSSTPTTTVGKPAEMAASSVAQPTGNGQVIKLSPNDLKDLILKQSFKAQEINFQAEQNRLALALIEKNYDFQLSADYGFTDSKLLSETNPYLSRDKNYTTDVSLTKPFFTGTSLSLVYTQLSDTPTYASSAPASQNTNGYTLDTVGLILKQNLISNSFGLANRADLRSAEGTYKATQITRSLNLQNLVLSAEQAYWTAFVAQEAFQEALNSRNRYLKLVETVKKKSGYGYSNPGDLAEAQAELEVQEQNVKQQSVNYLASLDNLETLLNLPNRGDIKFDVVAEQIAPPPAESKVEIEKLRPIRAAKLGVDAAKDAQTSADSTALPDLSVVGKYYTNGLDESSSEAQTQMTKGSHPEYYVGLQLNYNFGSGYLTENKNNKRISRQLAEVQLSRQRLELKDQEANLLRTIQSTYAVAQSTKAEKGLREKAAQELSKSYTQGRTDITILIQALNNYFDSNVKFTKAVGDYQIALNQWAAFRDDLIPEK